MKQIFILLFICIIAVQGFSETIELSVEHAVKLAAENNLSLKQESVELKTLKRKTIAAFNSLIPEVTGTAGLALPNDPRNPMTGSSVDPEWTLSIDISARLLINPAMFMAVRNTRLNYARGKIAYEAAIKSLDRDIKKNYYLLQLLAENIRLIESNLATAKRRYEREQNNFNYGSSSELTLLKSQAAYENLKPVLAGLQSDYIKAVYLFKVTLGINEDDTIILVSDLPDTEQFMGEEEIPVFKESDNPAVKELEAALIHLRHTKRTTQVAYFSPSIILGANYNPIIQNISDGGTWEDRIDNGGITLGVQVPIDALLPVSKESVEIRELNDSIETMSLQLEQLEKMTAVEIKTLVMDLDNALTSIEAYELNAELAEKVLELTESAYEAGVAGFIDVEDATDQYNQARIDLLTGRLDYINTVLDLEYAANVNLLGEDDEN